MQQFQINPVFDWCLSLMVKPCCGWKDIAAGYEQEHPPLTRRFKITNYDGAVFIGKRLFAGTAANHHNSNMIYMLTELFWQITPYLPELFLQITPVLRLTPLKCPQVLTGHVSGCWHFALGAGVPYNRRNTKQLNTTSKGL